MRAHDRLADRQAEPDPHHRALTRAALELLEQARRVAWRQARSLIVENHAHELAVRICGGRYQHARAGGGVLGDIVEEVGEHLHDQGRVHPYRRQLRLQAHLDRVRGELLRVGRKRAPQQVIERLPVASQYHLAGLEAHQIEHVRHQLRHLARLGLHRARQLQARGLIEAGAALRERAAGGRHDGQRRAQVVRDGGEQRVAQRLALGGNTRLLGNFRKARALERKGDLAGEGDEQMTLLRQQHAAHIGGQHRQHAHRAALIPERHVQPACGRQRVGPEAGLAAVIGDPLGNGQIGVAEGALEWCIRRVAELAPRRRQQHHGLALEHLGDVPYGHARHAGTAARGGELAAHGVKQRGAPLARARHARLLAHARGESGDHQRNGQHRAESHQILHVRHRERVARRHEEEIERGDIQHRSERRGAPTEPQARHRHPQQVDHDEVGQRSHARRLGVAIPMHRSCGVPRALRAQRRERRARRSDQQHIEAVREPHQLACGGGPQPCAPAAPLRRPHDDTGRAAHVRVLGNRGRGRGTVERHALGSEGLGETQHLDTPVALSLRQLQQRRGLHVHHGPLRIERIREALAGAHQLLGLRIRPHRNQHPITGLACLDAIHRQGARGRLDAVGDTAQSDLAQRQQVRFAEEALHRRTGLVTDVHLAGVQARDQVIGRQVDQLDVVGLVEHVIGQRLAL